MWTSDWNVVQVLHSLWVSAAREGSLKRQRSQLASCGETAGSFSWHDDSMENKEHLVSLRSCSREGLRERIQILPSDWMHIQCVCVCACAHWQQKLSQCLTVQDWENPPMPFFPFINHSAQSIVTHVRQSFLRMVYTCKQTWNYVFLLVICTRA